ncbi:hypothetical protein BDV06DRAFT_227148 [Aspergillus oleicola]
MLVTAIKGLGATESIALSLADASRLAKQEKWFFIVILDLETCVLAHLDKTTYHHVQGLLLYGHGILWVSRGGGIRSQLPEHAMIQGFFRSLRLEENQAKLITLSLEFPALDPACITKSTMQVFQTVTQRPVNLTQDIELRFADHRALRHDITTPGLLESLLFVSDHAIETTPLSPDEIEIEVKASGVNLSDCLAALGRVSWDHFGAECSGIVSRCGSQVLDFAVGDKVFTNTVGTYQTLSRCKASMALRIPEGMGFTEAVALPVVFATAVYALVHVAKIQPGESILIHSGAGGTGQAAIQIARMCQAEIYATVGSEEKRQPLTSTYQIPADHIFDSRSSSFARAIQRVTGGRGVDVVLNSLSGDLLEDSWHCVAPFGRFLEIGKKDIQSNTKLPMAPFRRNATFHAIDLRAARKDNPELLQRLQREIAQLLADCKIKLPCPIHVYGIGEVEQAFRYLQSGKNAGKTVVEIRPDDRVRARLDALPTWAFEANATYVIAGGLGGLGRATAR